ncbi:MAG TPA: alpha/beta hydrolase [Gemmatimonadaceae bacterium]|nr:alpha/beta hydrolase [Gemmatimonadaceae bacterium]
MLCLAALAASSLGAARAAHAQTARDGYVLSSDSVRIYYKVVGVGRDTVVVLHGGAGFTMDYLVPDLAPLGKSHTLIFYDQRGSGRSPAPHDTLHITAAKHVADLEALRVHFGIQRLAILGHSWGGELAALYAAAHPDRVARLVLEDPAPPWNDPRFVGAMDDVNAVGPLTDRSLAHENVLAGLSVVRTPVLIITGRQDPVPWDDSRLWAEALPDARLMIVEHAGHFVHVEQPEQFFPPVNAFLAGGWPAAAAAPASKAQLSVALLDYHATSPAGWVTVPAASSMRLAQYTIPARDSSVSAEAVVYFFGKSQGGNVEANLARWKAQFSKPDGSAVYEKVERDSSGAFPITIAEYRGTYARGIGAGDAANAKSGQSLVAVIAETPQGTLFFQLFGATATVTGQKAALVGFVRSMK